MKPRITAASFLKQHGYETACIGSRITSGPNELGFDYFYGFTHARNIGTTIHQSMGHDLSIRQGPWKLIFLKDGKRELYHLASDLGETHNVLEANAEITERLTILMKKSISDGRSTAGSPKKNEAPVSIQGGSGGRKKNHP